MAEIVRLIDYLAGRQSGIYQPYSPLWYSNKEQFRAPLCDSYKISNPPVSQPTYTSANEQHSYSERIAKITELKTLLYRYPRYFKQDPETILRSIIVYSSRSEDDSILEATLKRFRTIDKQQKNQAIFWKSLKMSYYPK